MKKLVMLSLATLALAGCNTPNHVEGRLAVKAPIKVRTKKDKVITLTPATYKATLDIEKRSAEVDVYTQQGKHSFLVPGVKPDAYGNINMSAAQLGQEFALQGKIYESTYNIDRIRAGSCVHHYTQEYKCSNQHRCVKDAAGVEHCGTENVCDWEQVPVYGTEDIHEVGTQDTKNVSINLIKGGRAAGTFAGAYTFRENISRSEVVSGCRL